MAGEKRLRRGVRRAATAAAHPEEVENALARRLLAQEVREGDRVLVDAGADGLTFEVDSPQLAPATVSTAA